MGGKTQGAPEPRRIDLLAMDENRENEAFTSAQVLQKNCADRRARGLDREPSKSGEDGMKQEPNCHTVRCRMATGPIGEGQRYALGTRPARRRISCGSAVWQWRSQGVLVGRGQPRASDGWTERCVSCRASFDRGIFKIGSGTHYAADGVLSSPIRFRWRESLVYRN